MVSEKICFIISPIGEVDSDIRKASDEKFDLVFKPVLEKLGYTPIRADKENSPNSISRDIVKRLINSELILADTTGFNANVFYELAIRNAVKKPVIIIKEIDTKLPFDVTDKRSISINMKDNRQWTQAAVDLEKHIISAEKDPKSASESIVSEYTFDLGIGKSPNSEQEMILLVKDLKDEVKSLRNDFRHQKQSSSLSLENLTKSYVISIEKDELSINDKLRLKFASETFDSNDFVTVEITDSSGSKVLSREAKPSRSTIGLGYPVMDFTKVGGRFAISVFVNDLLVYRRPFLVI